MTETRTPTAVDALAEQYLDEIVALNPLEATYIGIAGHDAELPAHDPDWRTAVSELRRRTLAAIDTAAPTDANDRITIAALREELSVAEELRAFGADVSELRNIASPLQ